MLDDKHGKRTWQEIAQEVVEEQDSQKLLKLTKELTEAVDGELTKPVSKAMKPKPADPAGHEAFGHKDYEPPPKTGTDGG